MSSRSGVRGIVINTAERAVSTDINRLQALSTAGMMELARFLLDCDAGSDDVQAGGIAGLIENVTTNSPMTCEVIGGLCVVPLNNTLQLGVTDGLALVVNPDASPSADDSVYKYVRDPGVLGTSGTLVMTPNATGFPRIDVVECTRVDDPNPEEDSRDVFNPTTGLFTAQTVQKTVDSVMSYRVRAGTPNSGFPGTASGYVPLAVVLVPAGATACDTMTFWDVRPMVMDRIFGGLPVDIDLPRLTKQLWSSNTGTGSQYLVNGVVECWGGDRRAGGRMMRGSPGVDVVGQVDFSDPANQEQGFSASGGPGLCYFYLVAPFGLPRWARYTDYSTAPTLRYPRSPRGIPLLSKIAPTHVYGVPLSAIEFPSVFGFNGASSQSGLCFGATTFADGTLGGMACSGGWQNVAAPMPVVQTTIPSTTVASGSNGTNLPSASVIDVASTTGFATAGAFYLDGVEVTYTGTTPTSFTGCTRGGAAVLATGDTITGIDGVIQLQENVQFPAGATRLRIAFTLYGVSFAASTPAQLFSVAPVVGVAEVGNTFKQFAFMDLPSKELNAYFPAGGGVTLTWVGEVELVNHYPDTTTGNAWDLSFLLTFPDGLPKQLEFGVAGAQVLAWKMES